MHGRAPRFLGSIVIRDRQSTRGRYASGRDRLWVESAGSNIGSTPCEMRLRRNAFLPEFRAGYNARFGRAPRSAHHDEP
jgi:hypothetical protein